MVGKFLFMFVSENFGFKSPNHIYFADLEKNGEIGGKIPLTPIYKTDFSSTFGVSRKRNEIPSAFHLYFFQIMFIVLYISL